MTIIVTDTGFGPDDFSGVHATPESLPAKADRPLAVTLQSDTAAADLCGPLLAADMIRVIFPSFSDGRGLTLARLLRQLGYGGRLRASGHIIADQYAMARRSGFDEVEISDELARRQPQAQWLFRADWQSHDYRQHLFRARLS